MQQVPLLNIDEWLFNAINFGTAQQVEELLRQGASANAINPDTGLQPLDYVSSFDETPETMRLIDILVEHGANVDGRPGHEYFPLRMAVEAGKNRIVQKLLSMGADVKKGQRYMRISKPIELQNIKYHLEKARHANRRPSKEVVMLQQQQHQQQQMSQKQATDLLFQGVQQLDSRKIRRAIRNGAQVNSRRGGETPMTILIQRNQKADEENVIKILKLLVQNNGNVNFKDSSNHTPLWFAEIDNKQRIAHFLKSKGGKTQEQTQQKERRRQLIDYATKTAPYDISQILKTLL